MLPERVSIVPAVLWQDRPEIVDATVGRSPRELRRWSDEEGLPMYRKGSGKQARRYWFTHEVIAHLKVTGRLTPTHKEDEES